MIRHLLVPLDGSPMAEQALPVAADLAARAGASVTLLHVVERHPPKAVHGQPHLGQADQAEAYLAAVAARAFGPNARVACHVHREAAGDVAKSLVQHVAELGPDLIVMSAHGPVRLRDRLSGNLAQQVMTSGVVPVLLLRPGPAPDAAVRFPFRHLLVPLDGQAEHEESLAPAADLAALLGAAVLLLTVVPTRGSLARHGLVAADMLPGASREMLSLGASAAAEYLEGKVAQLAARGLRAAGRVLDGDPARAILHAADQADSDLIVLSTHGKAGTHAFWSGSIGPRLLRRAKASFLLVPARPA
ncbi:MAG: universal stress protein [Planctomycetota bacterium]|nr:universal stress protein [Planctomycetota bacterium]